ncbi:MAG: hypothetical protein EOP92_21245, partial [Lysobacteraceae bacterium]
MSFMRRDAPRGGLARGYLPLPLPLPLPPFPLPLPLLPLPFPLPLPLPLAFGPPWPRSAWALPPPWPACPAEDPPLDLDLPGPCCDQSTRTTRSTTT